MARKRDDIGEDDLRGCPPAVGDFTRDLRGIRLTRRTTKRRLALFCAAASGAAYESQEWSRDVFGGLGFGITHHEEESTDTQLTVLESDEAIVVAFRGTKGWRDALTDANTRFHKRGKMNVHRGFWKALDSVWQRGSGVCQLLKSASDDGKLVILTGHSLGAALAFLAACRAEEAEIPIEAVITFGQPQVGAGDFIARFPQSCRATARFVNARDIVTLVPHRSLVKLSTPSTRNKGHGSGRKWLDYEHNAGRLFYIDLEGNHKRLPNSRSLKLERWKTHFSNLVGLLKPTMKYHAMSRYYQGVKANGEAIDAHFRDQ